MRALRYPILWALTQVNIARCGVVRGITAISWLRLLTAPGATLLIIAMKLVFVAPARRSSDHFYCVAHHQRVVGSPAAALKRHDIAVALVSYECNARV